MSRPEETPDRAGAYLDAVLSLDPAVDAAEILRRRREFLGRPGPPGSGGGRGGGGVDVDEEDRRARLESRGIRERKARQQAIAEGEKRPVRPTRVYEAPSRPAPVPKKESSPFSIVWAVIIIIKVIWLLSRSHK